MTTRPRLLDLFCGAGGCSVGYYRAGFNVVGVDCKAMERYPFEFRQADALEYLAEHGREFHAVHASPPCQRYSRCGNIPGRGQQSHPDLIGPIRELLVQLGKPWVIENVDGAPLGVAVMLCGTMFPGLRVYRHRWFESSILLPRRDHSPHRERIKPPGSKIISCYQGTPGKMVIVAGHQFSRASGSVAMGIDWMSRDELAQAIPPAYTEWVGRHLLAAVSSVRGPP